jgi:hypothetical protein
VSKKYSNIYVESKSGSSLAAESLAKQTAKVSGEYDRLLSADG